MKIQTINPATEAPLVNYECLNSKSVDTKIAIGHQAYLAWKTTTFQHRESLMLKLSQMLKDKKAELAVLIASEMGKPISAGQAEIEKCAWLCEHYATHAETYLAPRIVETEMRLAKVCHIPLGVVFAIMPWNFPFWQVLRFAVPTIMAGNVGLLKHAPITTGAGQRIEALFLEAGFPDGVFQHLVIDNDAAAQVIAHPQVVAVTLTGSERAGTSVAALAGSYLKKSVLELGGSDPYVILEDADLDLAAQCIVTSRLSNTGQVCIAAKRIIVIDKIADELVNKIQKHMTVYQMGDPLDPLVNLGPLARADLRETLQKQVEKSIRQGAKLLAGGIIPDGKGFYYPPTLLTEVKPGMPAFDEELFGPVIAIITASDENEAIQYANQTHFGLGAAIFTRDLERGEKIATHDIEAGVCFVNALVSSDPRIPFGGIKRSGYGRELSQEGILEFVNIKTIAVGGS